MQALVNPGLPLQIGLRVRRVRWASGSKGRRGGLREGSGGGEGEEVRVVPAMAPARRPRSCVFLHQAPQQSRRPIRVDEHSGSRVAADQRQTLDHLGDGGRLTALTECLGKALALRAA